MEVNAQQPEFSNPLNPVFLKNYLENFKNIMKRQMPNVTDEQLYQDAFVQMIELILPPEQKDDASYLQKIVEKAGTLQPPIILEIPKDVRIMSETKAEEREEKERQRRLDEVVRVEGKPLEDQLEDAEKAENFELAGELLEKIKRIRRMRGLDPETGEPTNTASDKYKGTLHIGEL